MKGYNSYLIFTLMILCVGSAFGMDQNLETQMRIAGPLNNNGAQVEIIVNRPSALQQAAEITQGTTRAMALGEKTLDMDLKRRDAELRRLESEAKRKKMEAEREAIKGKADTVIRTDIWNNYLKAGIYSGVLGIALGFIAERATGAMVDRNLQWQAKAGAFAVSAISMGFTYFRAFQLGTVPETALFTTASFLAFNHLLKK